MQLEQAQIVSQQRCSGDYWLMELAAPEIAATVQPGQFVHLRISRRRDLVLRRPFSVFKASDGKIWILYKRVGKGTAAMATLAAREWVSLIGPLGRGFPMQLDGRFPVIVAGGYGVAPLAFLAERLVRTGVVFIGAKTTDDLLCDGCFARKGWEVYLATEDGARGQRGLVTELLDTWLAGRGEIRPIFYACGPDGMLRAVAERALNLEAPAWISLDRRMGCGVGACLTCVQRVRLADGRETWARVCKEGPVFEAREIVWDATEQ